MNNQRIIKFRAWHKRIGRMYPVRSIDFRPDPMHVFLDRESIALDIFLAGQHVELMQFTELLDKHGNEIWEGDIVRVEGTTVATIIYDHAGYLYINAEHTFWLGSISPDLVEVIGNIHEHRSLTQEQPS